MQARRHQATMAGPVPMAASMPDLHAEALATFAQLFDEALAAGEPDRTAMTVATAALDARPSARTVLLKAFDTRGFVFYTHLDGRKGRELQANPHAALSFHWPRVAAFEYSVARVSKKLACSTPLSSGASQGSGCSSSR